MITKNNIKQTAKDVATHYFNLDGPRLCDELAKEDELSRQIHNEKTTLFNKLGDLSFKISYNGLRFGGIIIDLSFIALAEKLYEHNALNTYILPIISGITINRFIQYAFHKATKQTNEKQKVLNKFYSLNKENEKNLNEIITSYNKAI